MIGSKPMSFRAGMASQHQGGHDSRAGSVEDILAPPLGRIEHCVLVPNAIARELAHISPGVDRVVTCAHQECGPPSRDQVILFRLQAVNGHISEITKLRPPTVVLSFA
jgi:hypothetical protein